MVISTSLLLFSWILKNSVLSANRQTNYFDGFLAVDRVDRISVGESCSTTNDVYSMISS